MTTCAETRKLLDEFQGDELGPAERAAVVEHLHGCTDCEQVLAAIDLFGKRIRALPPQVPPPGFLGRLRARLAAERPGLDERDTAPLAWHAADTRVGEQRPHHAPSPLRVAA